MSEQHVEPAAPKTVSVAVSPAPTTTSVQDTDAWDLETLRTFLAGWLQARGVRSVALVTFAVSLAATAAFVLLVGHAGLGGVLGLVALIASELALVPQTAPARDTSRLARGVTPLVDLLMVAGLFGGIAAQQKAPMITLAFLVLVLLAWLPMLRSSTGQMRLADAADLLRRGERMGLLLFAVAVGRPGPALVMILAVGSLDAWLRVERLAIPMSLQVPRLPASLEHIIGEDGTLTPVARWATVGLTLLAVLALPQSGYWRF